MHQDIKQKLFDRIEFSDNCWNWLGYVHPKDGYGRFRRRIKTYDEMAHRLVYELFNNVQIDKNMTIDHLCLNKLCVNPKHLEIVTRGENSRRARLTDSTYTKELRRKNGFKGGYTGDTCKLGHNLKEVNWKSQRRVCQVCHTNRQRERRKALRGA